MKKELKHKLDRLVKANRLDQAYQLLKKLGYPEHHAGLLIHCALKASLANPSLVTKMDHDEHFCAACA